MFPRTGWKTILPTPTSNRLCARTHARLAAKKDTVAEYYSRDRASIYYHVGTSYVYPLRYSIFAELLSVKLLFIRFFCFSFSRIQAQFNRINRRKFSKETVKAGAEETRLVIGHRQPRWKLEKPQEYDGRRWLQGAWRTIIRVSEDWMNVDRPETGSLSISSVRTE